MTRRLVGFSSAALGVAVLGCASVVAQTADTAPAGPASLHCQAIDYFEPPAGSSAVVVDQVEGQNALAVTGSPLELNGPSGICVLLFRPGDETPITVGVTGEGGRFSFARPAPGLFVLVAASERIRDLAVAVRISDAPPDPDAERGLMLHVRAEGDDRGGFASVIRHLALRRELLEMRRLDQEVRNAALAATRDGVSAPGPEVLSRMASVDAGNIARLQEIVEKHGWPGSDLVGMDGAEGAFLVLQHGPPTVQKELFPLVEAGFHAGTVSGQSYALLLDRIRVGDGRPQVYGSQARPIDEWIDGEPALEPIEDEANVDARRAEVGLPPLAEYRELLKNIYLSER